MTWNTAAQNTRSQKIRSAAGAALTLLGLASVVGGLDQALFFLGVPLRFAMDAIPSILLAAWHLLEPCALGHLGLLDGLLQISTSCLQVVGTLAGAA